MKRIKRYGCVAVLLCLTCLLGHARTITVDVRSVKGDLTEFLRNTGKSATHNDTVVLNFDKGTYNINGSVVFSSHLVINGRGVNETTVIFNKGKDRPGFKAFNDDCFIDVNGTLAHPLSAIISQISFRIQDHKGILWENSNNYFFKIRHCNSVSITHVNSYTYNANTTNFDLQVCSNVNITDCEITNYNNSERGGCLWLRGETHNVNVKRNKFNKYGKDEAMAVFDRLVDNSKKYIRGKANRSNIFVEDNEFYYGYDSRDRNPETNTDMIFSLFTDHRESEDRCMTTNFHLSGNKFYVNDKTTRCIYIGFDPADDHRGIYIENNQIINKPTGRTEPYYRWDIDIHDTSASTDVIELNGNSVQNYDVVMNKSGTTGYTFLQMRGGEVNMANNTVVNNVSRDAATGKPFGVQLVWCQPYGVSAVNMTGNVCKGLDCVAHAGAWQTAQHFTLIATNNYFAGNTRVLCDNIDNLDLNFTGNTFNNTGDAFFLQEFAKRGTVVFNSNEVNSSRGQGLFMTHSSSRGSTQSMRFDKLEIKNNVFKGVRGEHEMLKHVTNSKKRKVHNNTYRM